MIRRKYLNFGPVSKTNILNFWRSIEVKLLPQVAITEASDIAQAAASLKSVVEGAGQSRS